MPVCPHIEAITSVKQPEIRECAECVKIGDSWVHLRTANSAARRCAATRREIVTPANMRTSRVIRSSLQRNPANAGCIAFPTTHLANTEFAQMWALFREPCDENVVR